MSIKLICIDMDGTLLMDRQSVSFEDKEAIREAVKAGVHVAITTGRVYPSAKAYSGSIGLNTPIIASNGAFIADSDGNEIYSNPLGKEDIEEFVKIAEKYRLVSYLNTSSGIITLNELPENHIYKAINSKLKPEDRMKIEVVKHFEDAFELYPNNILKGICISSENIEALLRAKEELQILNPDLEIVSSWDNNFEVMKKGSSKGEAVAQLAKYFNLNREEIMCIGDSENDLSMIEFAGIGVAMGNAMDIVKKAAQYITDDNMNSGVAKAIRKFVLDNQI